MDSPEILLTGGFSQLREAVRRLGRSGVASEIVEPPGCNANA